MQAARQSRAKVKRNIPPRSGDQPQQAVYSIPTRTTIERIATDRNKAKVRRRGRKPDENAKKQGRFCVICGHKPGYITQGTFQAAA
jgi:hypothetical protein